MSAGPPARLRAVLIGATGRMGREVLRVLSEYPALTLAAAVVAPSSVSLGQDAGVAAGLAPTGVPISADLPAALQSAQLAIDFSTAEAASEHLSACTRARVPLLLGTTGLPRELDGALMSAAATIPLLVSANTSLGIAVLRELVRAAAAALPEGYDIEILETHHRLKRDAPSGTALTLGEAVALARGLELHPVPAVRAAGSARAAGQIGFASLRGGDTVGEHAVLFLGEGERLTLSHSVSDRAVFARGALRAGQWLAAQRPGRYQMSDVLPSKTVS